jgi:hypothetical protein
MKDQIIALMEALRLVGVQIERFKRGTQGRDSTLTAIENIFHDPKVDGAVQSIQQFVDEPPLKPTVQETTQAA